MADIFKGGLFGEFCGNFGLVLEAEVFEHLRRLDREADGTKFRLIGIGISNYVPAAECDPPDLADPGSFRRKEIERTMDSVRQRFGRDAIAKGRNFGE